MAKKHHPRRGSMQFWPRKRSKKFIARIRIRPQNNTSNIQTFLGYKAGMTHIIATDNSPKTIYKNKDISIPVTVIESPPLKPLSIRFYKKSYQSLHLISEVLSKTLSKDIKKQWLENISSIGITAGASAPEILIQNVISDLQKKFHVVVRTMKGIKENVKFMLPKEVRA